MKKLLLLFLLFLFSSNSYSIPRFGELTEMFDPKMRGKDSSWVRPHPGPFVWEMIEREEGKFFWKDADKYVKYAQEHNQTIIATIWPYTKWDQKSCGRKKMKNPFGRHFPKRIAKPCSMEKYLSFLSSVVDRYDGDGQNDMPGLTAPLRHWEIMNEPEFKMFFSGKEDEFVEIFIESSKLIKAKQKDSVIIMAGAAGMHPDSKKFWSSALPKIENYIDIANIHHITGPDGRCDKEMWVDEFAKLLMNNNINKPIWVTEAMTGKCNAIEIYVNAFLSGAEIIVDVGINAPGPKMSMEMRNQLNKFIEKFNNFKSIKKLSTSEVEFELDNGSLVKYQY